MKTELTKKRNGIHYTPLPLANFLAEQIWQYAGDLDRPQLRILDPACGDGRLLKAMVAQAPKKVSIEVTGFETDPDAAEKASDSLGKIVPTSIVQQDFLDHAIEEPNSEFDIIITNPPYVRTQNLGADRTGKLRSAFKLAGRLDLYQAFTIASTTKLRVGGVLGLLTSNRFMYVQSGKTMRSFLLESYDLKQIYDFGDTRLFKASVLPVVLIGCRGEATKEPTSECRLVRVYETDSEAEKQTNQEQDLFKIVTENSEQPVFQMGNQQFRIESGFLQSSTNGNHWLLKNRKTERFQRQIEKREVYSFGELADIKVGIKTTADSVFIRSDWHELPKNKIPELELLKPLITHHVCRRWKSELPTRKVLYPYQQTSPRQIVDLNRFPNAERYLAENSARLKSRDYLRKSNRDWYEIWVPQVPTDWERPKIVWPDISEQPNFSLDESGAIVNGDCYWIKLKEGVDSDWLYLMLAVANSKLAVEFYDTNFHNKLYSRRRRFMTQYVKQFPLPDLDLEACRQIVELVKQEMNQEEAPNCFEHEIDGLVSSVFRN